jgi:hypothetical protein
MQDTLSFYGNTFQIKVLAALLRDKPFLQQVHDILDPKYFSSEANQRIASTIIQHFSEYKVPPTLEVFRVKVEEVSIDMLKTTVVEGLKEVFKYFDNDDFAFIRDKTLDFCKNQKLKSAILSSVQLLQAGEYDRIKVTIDEAMKAGSDRNVGHDYITDIEARFVENARSCIATPWDVLNEIMDGGLGVGEMGVFVLLLVLVNLWH